MGEIFALSAAVIWSLAVVLFKRGGQVIPPVSLNLFKSVLGLVLFAGTLVVLGDPFFPSRPGNDYLVLVVSGVAGITLSDTLFFFSLNLLGAGFVSIVECLYSPSVILFALVLLGETITPGDWAGLGLILLAMLTVTGRPHTPTREKTRILAGVLLGALSMGVSSCSRVRRKTLNRRHYSPTFKTTAFVILAGPLPPGCCAVEPSSSMKPWSVTVTPKLIPRSRLITIDGAASDGKFGEPSFE